MVLVVSVSREEQTVRSGPVNSELVMPAVRHAVSNDSEESEEQAMRMSSS